MKALVLVERFDAVSGLAAGARTLADEVLVVSFGDAELPEGVADVVIQIALPQGAVLDDAGDTVIALYNEKNPDVVLVEPTRHMKSIAGKLAAHLGVAVITDVFSLENDIASSLYFGGVGVRTQKPTQIGIYTIAPEVFSGAIPAGTNATEAFDWVEPKQALKLIDSRPVEKSGVDLNKAETVVGAGRGFAEKEDLELARALCEKINAGLGCSRPLTEGVDWLPSETYIGVSGLMLSPKVYVALGISGQMQHMVGCNRAQKMFAVNKDANAPIFKQCDYGLVGDIKTVLPALVAAL